MTESVKQKPVRTLAFIVVWNGPCEPENHELVTLITLRLPIYSMKHSPTW